MHPILLWGPAILWSLSHRLTTALHRGPPPFWSALRWGSRGTSVQSDTPPRSCLKLVLHVYHRPPRSYYPLCFLCLSLWRCQPPCVRAPLPSGPSHHVSHTRTSFHGPCRAGRHQSSSVRYSRHRRPILPIPQSSCAPRACRLATADRTYHVLLGIMHLCFPFPLPYPTPFAPCWFPLPLHPRMS